MPVPKAVKIEVECWVCLLFSLFIDFRRGISASAYAVDASSYGCGVCMSRLLARESCVIRLRVYIVECDSASATMFDDW